VHFVQFIQVALSARTPSRSCLDRPAVFGLPRAAASLAENGRGTACDREILHLLD